MIKNKNLIMTIKNTGTKISVSTDKLRTEEAICFIKEDFSKRLAQNLNLVKVSAPIAVLDGTGINDDLNGIERPVRFSIKHMNDMKATVVQSLAKWKRLRLKELNIKPGGGLLTDMRALRPDEDIDPIHSIYVDQWDWERHILPEQRDLDYLKSNVSSIYAALKSTEDAVCTQYSEFKPELPDEITFIQAEELLRQFPKLSGKQRESEIAREFGAVFIIGIGGMLSNGEPHDGRAPDYDDWITINEDGYPGLNGDIILWNRVRAVPFEISSMGIRVDKDSLAKQLEMKGCSERGELQFHKMLLNNQLPLSIGGGIGQSRLCMHLLRKSHIGEVQASIWTDQTKQQLAEEGIELL
jgi:aspartate--ammonia ligase